MIALLDPSVPRAADRIECVSGTRLYAYLQDAELAVRGLGSTESSIRHVQHESTNEDEENLELEGIFKVSNTYFTLYQNILHFICTLVFFAIL